MHSLPPTMGNPVSYPFQDSWQEICFLWWWRSHYYWKLILPAFDEFASPFRYYLCCQLLCERHHAANLNFFVFINAWNSSCDFFSQVLPIWWRRGFLMLIFRSIGYHDWDCYVGVINIIMILSWATFHINLPTRQNGGNACGNIWSIFVREYLLPCKMCLVPKKRKTQFVFSDERQKHLYWQGLF